MTRTWYSPAPRFEKEKSPSFRVRVWPANAPANAFNSTSALLRAAPLLPWTLPRIMLFWADPAIGRKRRTARANPLRLLMVLNPLRVSLAAIINEEGGLKNQSTADRFPWRIFADARPVGFGERPASFFSFSIDFACFNAARMNFRR